MLSIHLYQDFPWDCSITYFRLSVNISRPYYEYLDLNRGILIVWLFCRIVIQMLTKPVRVPTIVNLWCLPSCIKQEPVKIPYPESEVKPTDSLARFTDHRTFSYRRLLAQHRGASLRIYYIVLRICHRNGYSLVGSGCLSALECSAASGSDIAKKSPLEASL